MQKRLRPLSSLLVILVATGAQAQVESFSIERMSAYNIEPGPSGYFIESTFRARVETTNVTDLDAFTISGPFPADAPQTLTKTGNVYELFTSAGSYPEALLENYPLGDYLFSGSGGTLGDLTATLHDGAEFTSGPSFLNYDQFVSRAPGQAVSIQIGSLTPRAGATHNYAKYSLFTSDGLGGYTILDQGVHEGTSPFSFGVGAGITEAGRPYYVGVEFHSDEVIQNAGFGGATGTIGWGTSVGTYFYTEAVPEPASLAVLGLGALLALRRRR
ncbi:PEP-CTERM sorting domain-containing protein [bacterium]|nr:MAG: PEP-CTERM sorting domain-containing protein [bacterium]